MPDEQGDRDMAKLLAARQQLAKLRGYKTWCEYAQRESLFQTPDRVADFLDTVWEKIRPGIFANLDFLSVEKVRLGGEKMLDPWDVPFLLEQCKEADRVTHAKISRYLTYDTLVRSVALILSQLFDLTFQREWPERGEVWHKSVEKYVLRKGDDLLGVMYLDPFMRPGKMVQSAQFTLQGSKVLPDGSRQTPKTALIYALPGSSQPLLPSYAATFMHEIGHALHSLLSETVYQHLSGTRGAIDFVEFPSHLFEHFIYDSNALTTFVRHPESASKMPSSLEQLYEKGRTRFAHLEAAQQLMYAVMDQAFYSHIPSAGSTPEENAHSLRCHLDDTLARFDTSFDGPLNGPVTSFLGLMKPSMFDHLVHYGGSYYCYIFNRAFSVHVWENSFQADLSNKLHGERLCELLRGGSVTQTIEAIEGVCPGAGGFSAAGIPLDAFMRQLGG